LDAFCIAGYGESLLAQCFTFHCGNILFLDLRKLCRITSAVVKVLCSCSL